MRTHPLEPHVICESLTITQLRTLLRSLPIGLTGLHGRQEITESICNSSLSAEDLVRHLSLPGLRQCSRKIKVADSGTPSELLDRLMLIAGTTEDAAVRCPYCWAIILDKEMEPAVPCEHLFATEWETYEMPTWLVPIAYDSPDWYYDSCSRDPWTRDVPNVAERLAGLLVRRFDPDDRKDFRRLSSLIRRLPAADGFLDLLEGLLEVSDPESEFAAENFLRYSRALLDISAQYRTTALWA